jgi:hypothetical protein
MKRIIIIIHSDSGEENGKIRREKWSRKAK